ncbi:zf-HC2 domain-containing protein [Streptomyces sp. NPDC058256]|uniref:zf-HC2 domain-containing protein n=1 Tax=Streptomyces sp. NPDC058256 TaxID=3346408 RepID=UPI0036E8EA42
MTSGCPPHEWLVRYALGEPTGPDRRQGPGPGPDPGPDPGLAAAEAHLDACDDCTRIIVRQVRRGPHAAHLDALHVRVMTAVHSPSHRSLPLGSPSRRSLPGLSAAPALRWSWAAALLGVCATGVVLARLPGVRDLSTGWLLPFLLMCAPLLPLLGVAMSYGPQADPFHEVAAVSPSGGIKLLLWRTGQILAVCLPVLTLTGFLLPRGQVPLTAAAWLLPSLGLTLATLALGSWLGCGPAAVLTGGGWLAAVGVPVAARLTVDPAVRPRIDAALLLHALSPLMSPTAQGGWALGAGVCCVVLFARRRAFGGAVGAC